ncbi:MAG: hypothetical protein ACOH2V_00120 [Candidatus Saccharimonadaceae bacterium]
MEELDLEEGLFDNDPEATIVNTPEEVDLDLGEPIIESEESLFEENIIDEPIIPESLVDEFLRTKGIDKGVIKILDENEEKEVNFYDLTKEEQLEILNSSDSTADENLEDSEIELINLMRTNNLTPEEFLAQYRESILAEMQQQAEPSYEIDNYDDNELFLLDLKNKYDLTDEELQTELEKELTNPELFAKKTGKLRTEYKESEDLYNASKTQELEDDRLEKYNQFTEVMDGIATETDHYHGVYLEDTEKTETLSYLLDLDDSGVSQFSKELNDPNRLFEAAWYLRYGKEAFAALENAYEAEIAKLKKQDKPRVVVQGSKKPINNINELY